MLAGPGSGDTIEPPVVDTWAELDVRSVADGTVLSVRVSPGARRSAVVGLHGHALRISVQAPPERGKANQAVCEVLGRALGLPTADVAVVAGTTSRDKRVQIRGLVPSEVRRRLGRHVGSAR